MDTYVRLATIIVKDLEESVQFYSETLGFEIASEYVLGSAARITLMRGKGDALVELIESDNYPVGFYSVGISVSDIDEAVLNYKNKGATILSEPVPITGGRLAFIEDPNGVRLAIIQKEQW